MSVNKLKEQISNLKKRISQLDQFGYEEESATRTVEIRSLEIKLEELEKIEFEKSQEELKKLLKEKEETPKRTRRPRREKVVEEETPE